MRKRFMPLLGFFCAVALLSAPSRATEQPDFSTPICLTVNNQYLSMDSAPFFYAGSTFVPIRFLGEALGAEIQWDSETACASIRSSDTELLLPAGKNYAVINGKKTKLQQGIQLINDRTYVPVRFAAEALGFHVVWDESTYTVKLSKEGITLPDHLTENRGYSDDEIFWLSKIIHAESQGEPMQGKIAVGNVVLNRVSSNEFPNTIYSVIFDTENGVQFSPVLDGSIRQTPLGDSVIAAKRALSGENTAENCLYFLNPKTATSSWIIRNRTYHKSIANHDFYL